MRELTAENVTKIFMACLFQEGEEVVDPVLVQALNGNFGFSRSHLNKYKVEISELLSDLPARFHKDTGGGWSFLNACTTKDGVQWGEHKHVEELLCLGLATEQVELLLPRDMWKLFPGGMPYFVVNPPSHNPFGDPDKTAV